MHLDEYRAWMNNLTSHLEPEPFIQEWFVGQVGEVLFIRTTNWTDMLAFLAEHPTGKVYAQTLIKTRPLEVTP